MVKLVPPGGSGGDTTEPVLEFVPLTGVFGLGSGDVFNTRAGSVSTVMIEDNAVTAGKIANNQIDSTILADTAVTPGSYTHTSMTVDAGGRITACSSRAQKDWITATMSTYVTLTAVDVSVKFNNSSSGGATGIPYNSTTGVFTLTTDKMYIASFNIIFANTTDYMYFEWRNSTGTVLSGQATVFRCEHTTPEDNNGSIVTMISTAGGINLLVKVVVALFYSAADTRGDYICATIHEI